MPGAAGRRAHGRGRRAAAASGGGAASAWFAAHSGCCLRAGRECPDGSERSEHGAEAAKPQRKAVLNQKTKSSPRDLRGTDPTEGEGHGEPSGTSENGSVSPAKRKRGRKPKAEMLLLKLSQDLECPSPKPVCVQKMLGGSEAAGGLENPTGGRPKRRAAKV